MAGILPSVIGLGANGMYLEYIADESQGQWHARVRRTSRMVLSENNFTRFIVTVSRTSGLIHLQTAFNKKYLRLETESGNFIAATADEPEEDRSKWSCTLFRRVMQNGQLGLVLQAQNGQHAVRIFNNSLNVVRNTSNPNQFFSITNMEQLVMLPRNIMFTGDNNHPLRARKNNWLQFLATSAQDPRLHHVVETLPNGDVRIIATRYNLYWRKSPNREWIWCDGPRNNPGRDSLFRPLRLSSNNQEIALMSMLQGKYCQRWPSGTNSNCLTASASSVIPLTVMRVGEAIRERRITDIIYRTNEARVHSKVPLRNGTQIVTNWGYSEETQIVSFNYTEKTESTFSSTHTWKISLTSNLRVSLVPKLVTGTVQLGASAKGSYTFNQMDTATVAQSGSTTATVPPRSEVPVTMSLSQGKMDVPYSYKQRDILFDGTSRVTQLHDGIFVGVDTFIARFIIGPPKSIDSSAEPNHYSNHDYKQGNNPNIVISPVTTVDLAVDLDDDEHDLEQEPQVPSDSDSELEINDDEPSLRTTSKL